VSVNELPAQIVVLPEGVMVAVGKALTTTVVFPEVVLQPWLLVTTKE
jgi:hypothetical protein